MTDLIDCFLLFNSRFSHDVTKIQTRELSIGSSEFLFSGRIVAAKFLYQAWVLVTYGVL